MERYGLIGKSLKHSFSKSYFESKFSQLPIANYQYLLIELADLQGVQKKIKTLGLSGFNVTIPYKKEIITYCDFITDDARMIGAVNCVLVLKDQRWFGFNTDMLAIQQVIESYKSATNAKALIIGAGGAAQAVKLALDKLNITAYIVTRSLGSAFSFESLKDVDLSFFQFIIQCTPVGMYPDIKAAPNIEYAQISSQHVCIDLIYNPIKTLFLEQCENQGAIVENGYRMLTLQADLSWKIWQDGNEK